MENKELVIFESHDKSVKLEVELKNDTVWLNRKQLAELFDRDIKTIGKHVNNALREELSDVYEVVVAKFATVQLEGNRKIERILEYYNLDVIISVGYRVKSKRGIEFRRWANSVLKEYIMHGYAINDSRMQQLGNVLQIMKRAEKDLDAKQVLDVITKYNTALDMLDEYDHQTMKKPNGRKTIYTLTYEECRTVIDKMKFTADSDLFGNEKDESFKGSIGNIYQSFAGQDIYPSLEEKAANLLYFVVKNHCFSDGNKRIAATIFLYFLDKNEVLFYDGEKLMDDYTLVALTIMIAESKASEKEIMIKVIMNCLSKG